MWCSICGISGTKTRLFDMVGQKEIVKVCENCAKNESLPVIRKPTIYQLQTAERRPSLNERLARFTGIKVKEDVSRTNLSLRQMINRNYEKNIGMQKKPRPDLVHNFHWTILRVRRARHVTQEQMARDLGEPDSAIRLAERGILPNDSRLVKKIEDYLGVKLIKSNTQNQQYQSKKLRRIDINPDNARNLKIADLQRMKEETSSKLGQSKEAEMFWDGEEELTDDLEKENGKQ